jgi:biopolymer transport protein ExbD
MALKQRNKVNVAFSMASMTDSVFLLLLFFMIAFTMAAPNALKLLLPESNSQTVAKAITTISITSDLKYYINENGDLKRVAFSEIEPFVQRAKKENEETYISLHTDKTVPVEYIVQIMNIAMRNQVKMILATAPEQ